MEILQARLLKKFRAEDQQGISENYPYRILNEFDFLEIKSIQSLTEPIQKEIQNFDEQRIYLFDSFDSKNSESNREFINPDYEVQGKKLPFIVMVMVKDTAFDHEQPFDDERYKTIYNLSEKNDHREGKSGVAEQRIFYTFSDIDRILLLRTNYLEMAHQYISELKECKQIEIADIIFGMARGHEKELSEDEREKIEASCNVPEKKYTCHQGQEYGKDPYTILEKYKEVRNTCEQLFSTGADKEDAHLKRAARYADDVMKSMQQDLRFFYLLRYQAEQGINPEFYFAIQNLLHKLEILIAHFGEIMVERKGQKVQAKAYEKIQTEQVKNAQAEAYEKIRTDLIVCYERFLEQVHVCIHSAAEYLREMTDLQGNTHGYKFRGSGAASKTKLALGYWQYATKLSQALYEEHRKQDGSMPQENPFAFLVTFETMKEKVSVTERFYYETDYDQRNRQPEKASIIHIKIAHRSAFDVKEVLAAITHEVAHHVGFRDREARADSITKCVCHWFAKKTIRESAYTLRQLKNGETQETLEELQKGRGKDIFSIVPEKRKELQEQLEKVIQEQLTKEFGDKKWAYQRQLKEKLISIFYKFINGYSYSEEDGEKIDVPTLVVNANIEAQKDIREKLFQWLRKKENVPMSEQFKIIMDLARSDDELLSSEMMSAQEVFSTMRDGKAPMNSFYDYKAKDGKLESRGSLRKQEEKARLTFADVIEDFCQTYSETYCDMLTVKLLDLTGKEYLQYVQISQSASCADNWRMYTVLKNGIEQYKDTGEEEENLKNKAKGYVEENVNDEWTFNKMIEEYLKKIFETESIQAFIDEFRKEWTACKEEGEQFRYLYRLYEEMCSNAKSRNGMSSQLVQ